MSCLLFSKENKAVRLRGSPNEKLLFENEMSLGGRTQALHTKGSGFDPWHVQTQDSHRWKVLGRTLA